MASILVSLSLFYFFPARSRSSFEVDHVHLIVGRCGVAEGGGVGQPRCHRIGPIRRRLAPSRSSVFPSSLLGEFLAHGCSGARHRDTRGSDADEAHG